MKKALLLILLLVVVGVGASLYLIPRTPELALINFQDKRFLESREAYEQQLREGQITPEVADHLVTLYLQENRVADAINVMEQYLATRPADLAARRRLGQLYQFAQRPDDYLRNLEEISRLEPSAEVYNELSQIYNFKAEYDKQEEALKQLIKAENEANPQRFKDLANIQASRASKEAAVETLSALYLKHPEAFTFREMELLVSLQLDTGKVEDAYNSALSWRQKNAPGAEVARLVNLLHFKGGMAQAAQLLGTYDDATLEADANLLTEKVLLQLDMGQEDDAYARLKTLYKQDKLDAKLQNRLLFLAIARADNETANGLMKNLDVKALNESEAMALLELSLAKGDVAMQRNIANAYKAEEYKASHPLLSAMLAVANRDASAKEQLARLEKSELNPQQNLQVARVCLRLKEYSCSETFLARLPASDALSDKDVAAVGNLYLELKAYEKGTAFIERMAKSRNSATIEEVRVKFAAVRGDAKAVTAWMGANPNASRRTLSDLYFASTNNGHKALAVTVAETLYAREKDADTRSYLASAYIKTGAYAKALPLLRENRNASTADENNYLLALTKLAPSSPDAKKELGQYAGSKLNANLPYERKMALIYALIQADQVDVAMPYIRELALKNGGQWAWLYADRLTKAGRHEEAREFWIALSQRPSTSPKEKRAIAFNLLQGGYTRDAEPIFRELALTSGADSDDAKRLLWMWGPRLNAEQLDWLAARYNASSGREQALWANYIAAYSAPEELIPFAENRHPETLYAEPILRTYVAGLAKTGQLSDKNAALLQAIREQNDPALTRAYAEAAYANNHPREAREAYDILFGQAPADNSALRMLGILTFAQADYAASEDYLAEYMRGDGLTKDTPENAMSAAYTYAELLRRSKRAEEAAPYYEFTARQADAYALTSPEALSKKAQSEIWLGNPEQGLATLREANERYPNNDVLRADYVASLVELKRYEDARAQLQEPLARSENPEPVAEAIVLPASAQVDPRLTTADTEALIGLSGSEEEIRQFAEFAQNVSWVSYTSQAQNKLLIGAKPGYTLQYVQNDAGQPTLVAIPSTTATAARQSRLRYQLLAARTDLETGKVHEANQRLNTLLPEYPADAQLLGFAANAANYGGNPYRAQALLGSARAIAPENQDIALLDRDIRRGNGPHVKIDQEFIKRGNKDREQITTLSAEAKVSDNVSVGAIGQHNKVRTSIVTNVSPAGLTKEKRDRRRNRAELYGVYSMDNGDLAKLSLFANDEKPGIGMYYEFLNVLGKSGIVLEYQRPYWDFFSQAVAYNTTRDRVSLWHGIKPTPQWDLKIEPGLNRYNIDGSVNAANSWSLDGRVVYRPIENLPYLYLAYGLSAEYFEKNEQKISFTPGTISKLDLPVPFKSREIHFVSLNTGYQFNERTYASALVGYGYDRLGGNGPMIEGRLTHELNDNIDAQVRGSIGFDPEGGGDETHLGGYLRYRF